MTKTVKVKTRLGMLTAPRGFGATYKRLANQEALCIRRGHPGEVIGVIRDLLGLIRYEASIEAVSDWDAQKRIEATAYAANVHARASDNPVQRHPKPAWIPDPCPGGMTLLE